MGGIVAPTDETSDWISAQHVLGHSTKKGNQIFLKCEHINIRANEREQLVRLVVNAKETRGAHGNYRECCGGQKH
jgi:hypothetical protein